MKKFLFASLFAACAAMGLSSCMNGDYDATPNASNANPNPLANSNNGGNGGSGGSGGGSGPGTAAKGEIRFTLNGSQNVTYSGAGINYTIVGTNDRLVSGGTTTATGDTKINVFISGYNGPNTYSILGTSTYGKYSITPFGGSSDDYNTTTGSPTGSGTVTVTSDSNDEMIGTFSFTAYNGSGTKVTITNGSFDVVKF